MYGEITAVLSSVSELELDLIAHFFTIISSIIPLDTEEDSASEHVQLEIQIAVVSKDRCQQWARLFA